MDQQDMEARLLQQRDELRERLQKINRNLRQRDEPVAADFAEQVAEQENVDVLYALEDEGKQELAQVERALRRISEGEFGICTQCGADIAGARLEALPYTDTCIDCANSS